MKKKFGFFLSIWVLLFALFNVIVFIAPNEMAGMIKFGGAFWTGYIFITVAFIAQLVCSFFAFKAENIKKMFYNIPLLTISYTGLIVMIIAGAACMAIPDLPNWIGIIICALILVFNAVAVMKASAAAEAVIKIDERVKNETEFIKGLIARSNVIMNQHRSEETKKVYEALRYSDPIDNTALAECNSKLLAEFNAFADAVNADDPELIKCSSDSLLQVIETRNILCKNTK